ncbi:hypothetical protein F5Y01DRAFT_173354 [Xylaria sp. FL0043]|nr:hypothetical protein F5Y01DRAFT_173354 [Xylaria sp. FL0043]
MTFSDLLSLLKACCCFPTKRSRPGSPIRRASHYNTRLREKLGLEAAVHNTPYTTKGQEPRYGHSTSPRQPSPRPRIMAEARGSGSSSYSNESWATSDMNRRELKELFNLVHQTLEHVPYAICGLAALIDHGFTARKVSRISIICRQESRKNVKLWAKANGYETYTDSIGIPLRDGSIRRVRIKYLEFGFETLQRVHSSFSDATVLSLTSQLDNVAAGYLDHRRRGGNEKTLDTIAADVFFCLDQLASRREHVEARFLPTFLGESFFTTFTSKYVDARPKMAMAGIDVARVLAKHRAASALREHDEMLRGYGMRGDVTPPEPGQFELMKNLSHRKSVYTIRDQAAHDSDVPPMPPLPDPAYMPAKTTGGSRNDPGRNLTAPKPPKEPKPAKRPVAKWV